MESQTCSCSDRRKLLNEISKIGFVLTDLNLYLDTHPYDDQALEYYKKYNDLKAKLTQEYTSAYGPICMSILDSDLSKWKWALQDWPWEGGYQ